MSLSDYLSPVLKSFSRGKRRMSTSRDRAHLEHRPIAAAEMAEFARRLVDSIGKLDRVRGVHLEERMNRVTVTFEAGAYRAEDLEPALEAIERAVGAEALSFDRRRPAHPADAEPVVASALELGASALGAAASVALRMTIVPKLSLGTNLASALSVIGAVKRLRKPIDRRIGEETTDHLINILTPLAYGSSQQTLSPVVDVFLRGVQLAERAARRRTYVEREDELYARPPAPGEIARPMASRALPKGPIEDYEDHAWQVSLGAFASSVLTQGNLFRAVPSLFLGLPKPARLGREAFAAALGRELAARNIVIVDPSVLRRLDRIDCLVIEGNLLPRERFLLGAVRTEGMQARDARSRAQGLLSQDDVLTPSTRDGYTLAPLPMMWGAVPDTLAREAIALASQGALVLGLSQGSKVVAICEVQITPQTGVEELIKTARSAHMRVVVASRSPEALERVDADDVIPPDGEMAGAIKAMQAEGRVVAVVATGGSPGLAVADLAVGLCAQGKSTPWEAHLICGEDLSDARFVLQACLSAKRVSTQSVRVAVGAATAGALVSAGGLLPLDAGLAMLLVNGASLVSMGNGVRLSYDLAHTPLPRPRDPTPWHALDPEGVLARLDASRRGLSQREAERRNKPEVPPVHPVVRLGQVIGGELLNPMVPLLAAGAAASAFVGSLADAGIVTGVIGLNAAVGGVQRFRTERAVQALGDREERRATTLRGGERKIVPARELVPGDIVLLQAGDVVPADARILEATSLEVDASSLTGESMPVSKSATPSFAGAVAERASMLHEGTSIAAGRATAVIVAVGQETEARRGTAGPQAPSKTGVEARLTELMSFTGPAAAAAGFGLAAINIMQGKPLRSFVGTAVSLAVAAVPEGLPLLATAAQLAAARRLSGRGALVRHPRAIEALGRVTTLCVDKTGTLTEGRLGLGRVSDGAVSELQDALTGLRRSAVAAALRACPEASDAAHTDAVDEALRRAAQRQGIALTLCADNYTRRAELAFEPSRGYHAVLGDVGDASRLSVKGAPETLLPRCVRGAGGELLDEARREALKAEAERLAGRGLRVLAVAERQLERGVDIAESLVDELSFCGFIAFSDPVRSSARDAVALLRRAGIDVVMVTGDHPSTAVSVAGELDLLGDGAILTGAEIDRLSEDELSARLARVSVIARVTPAEKVKVVRALQRARRVVAMTGDGTNDAPAMRQADVGVALGSRSTSAARSAADIVLTDERIETLVDAIVEGRAMWSSVRDAVSVLVGGNVGEIGTTVAAGLLGAPGLNPRQLLLINLLTDIGPALAIAVRTPDQATREAALQEGPDAGFGRSLYRDIAARSVATAVAASGASVVARIIGDERGGSTVSMVTLVGAQLGQTLASGTRSASTTVAGLGSAAVLAAIVQMPGVSHFFGCRPLGPAEWATAVTASGLATAASSLLTEQQRSLVWRVLEEAEVLPLLLRNRDA